MCDKTTVPLLLLAAKLASFDFFIAKVFITGANRRCSLPLGEKSVIYSRAAKWCSFSSDMWLLSRVALTVWMPTPQAISPEQKERTPEQWQPSRKRSATVLSLGYGDYISNVRANKVGVFMPLVGDVMYACTFSVTNREVPHL